MNKLAIVIPYYKIDFFEETLKSISKQTDGRFTLYIGNDASPCNPDTLITKYLSDKEYHYFNYDKNLGGKNLTDQWERILENVRENWFQILGDDDIIADNFVEEFYSNLTTINSHKVNVIKVSQFWINEKNIQITQKTYTQQIANSKDFFIQKLQGRFLSSLSEHIFRTEKYREKKFRHLPLAWGTDDLAVLEISEFSDFFFLDTTNVLVRISSVSITGSNDTQEVKNEKFNALEQLYRLLFFDFKNHFSTEEIKAILKEYYFLCWKEKKVPSLPLSRIYLYLNDYKSFFMLPKKYISFYINQLRREHAEKQNSYSK